MPIDNSVVISTQTIAQLCKEHRHRIDNIKLQCTAERKLDEAQFTDDLFVLRFVLSHLDDVDKALDAYRETCKWRHQNRDVLQRIRDTGRIPHQDDIDRYMVGSRHKTLADGICPVYIVRAGISNAPRCMDEVPVDAIREYFIFNKEMNYQLVDAASRKSGRIVRLVSIMDMKHAAFSSDGRFMQIMGEGGKVSEPFYPQLLGLTVVCNMPFWFRAMMAIAKVFLSARSLEKMRLCYGKTLKEDLKTCPYAASMFKEEDLPTFLGGKCTCGGAGCINGIPNEQSTMVLSEPVEDEETED